MDEADEWETTEPDLPDERSGRGSWAAFVILLVLPVVGACAGWLVAALVLYVTPKKYESTAVIQVNPAVQEVDPFGGMADTPVTGAYMTRQFFATEFALLTAEQTLKRVVDRLDLTSRWNQDPGRIVEVLRGIVSTEQIRGTDLIKIRVRHPSAQDARDIAEKVAEAYKERRTSIEMDRAHRALNALDTEVRDQEDIVEEKRKVLDIIVQAVGIPYFEDRPGGGGAHGEALLKGTEKRLAELRMERQEVEARVNMLRKLKPEEVHQHAAALELPANPAMDLERELRTERRVLEGLRRAGLGSQNPEVIRQEARVEVLEEDIAEATGSTRRILEARLEMLEAQTVQAQEMLDQQRARAVDEALSRHAYVEAKREYEQTKKILQAMKFQHATQRIALQIPKNPITVHEAPMVARTPVAPDVDAGLWRGSAVGFGLGLLLAMPIALVSWMRR